MRAFWTSIPILLALCQISNADPTTDREKRRQHVPYVRASTDCLANAVARSPSFKYAVELDNFRPLTAEAMDVCKQTLLQMVKMHDAIYGTGGMDFFKGPYLSDLDRAIRARLASSIAATRAEIARLEDQRKADAARIATERAEAEAKEKAARAEKVAGAERVRDIVRDRAMACIGRQALPMLVTDEKAEIVAKAAMLFCESEVNAFTAAVIDVLAARGEAGNEQAIRIAAKKRVEEIATAHIIRAKAELILGTRPDSGKQEPSKAPTL
jgi:hypothetical protein